MRTPLSIVMLDSTPKAQLPLLDILPLIDVQVHVRDRSLGIVRAAIAKHDPSVVFVDVDAANVGGPGATRQIKRQFPDAKVIAVTEMGSCRELKGMIDAGACGYIFRDADPYAVRSLIECATKGRQVYCQKAVRMLEHALPTPFPRDKHHYLELEEEYQKALDLVILGLSSAQIAEELGEPLIRVKQHVRMACKAYNVESRVELVVAALREGVDPYKVPEYHDLIAKYDPDYLETIEYDEEEPEPEVPFFFEPEPEPEPEPTGPRPRYAAAVPLRPADPNDLFEGLLDEWE